MTLVGKKLKIVNNGAHTVYATEPYVFADQAAPTVNIDGSYAKAVRHIALRHFCTDLLVGRRGITLDCPSLTALLDPIAYNIALHNAITDTVT